MNRYTLPILSFALTALQPARSQPVRLEGAAGGGASVLARDKTGRVGHTAGPGWSLRLQADIPLGPRYFIRTGAGYQQRILRYDARYTDEDRMERQVELLTTTRFAAVPLQVGYVLFIRHQPRLELAAGMSYNVLLRAHSDVHIDYYYKGRIIQERQEMSYNQDVRLVPADTRLGGQPWSGFFLFNPAVRADLAYRPGSRTVVRLFYERHLYNMNAGSYGGELKPVYAGLELGYRFR